MSPFIHPRPHNNNSSNNHNSNIDSGKHSFIQALQQLTAICRDWKHPLLVEGDHFDHHHVADTNTAMVINTACKQFNKQLWREHIEECAKSIDFCGNYILTHICNANNTISTSNGATNNINNNTHSTNIDYSQLAKRAQRMLDNAERLCVWVSGVEGECVGWWWLRMVVGQVEKVLHALAEFEGLVMALLPSSARGAINVNDGNVVDRNYFYNEASITNSLLPSKISCTWNKTLLIRDIPPTAQIHLLQSLEKWSQSLRTLCKRTKKGTHAHTLYHSIRALLRKCRVRTVSVLSEGRGDCLVCDRLYDGLRICVMACECLEGVRRLSFSGDHAEDDYDAGGKCNAIVAADSVAVCEALGYIQRAVGEIVDCCVAEVGGVHADWYEAFGKEVGRHCTLMQFNHPIR